MVLSNLSVSPRVSIIILNYNSSQYLEACISTVMDTNLNSEVIVVDNASNDGSIELLKELKDKYDQLNVVFLSRNLGFSVGNNIGSKYAHGKYLLFLNPDTFVNPDWLEALVLVLDADETIGAAQPKMLMPDKIFDSAGGFMTPLGLAWCRGYNERDTNQYNELTDIFFAKGAALMVRKSIFDRVGKFDPLFFLYYEETDLCWRIWMTGHRVVYVPQSIVYHVGAAVLRKHKFRTKYNEAKGRIVMLIKNHSTRYLLWAPSLTLFLSALNILRHIARGDSQAAVAITKGSVWWLFNLKKIWKHRLIQKAAGLHFLKRMPTVQNLPVDYFHI